MNRTHWLEHAERAPGPIHGLCGRARSMKVSALAAAAALALAACGGSNTTPSGTGADGGSGNGTMSGVAVKGPVNGGTMTAFAVTNGAKGQQIGAATTDAQGRFTMDIGSYSGPVVMQLAGGAYTDEATGGSMSMASGDVMRAVVPTVATGSTTSGIMVTPLTSMAQARCQALAGGMTDANITTANSSVGNYFLVNDILHTMPMDPLVQGSGTGASADAKNYGMAIAGMSQYAHMVGMTASSGMVTVMMDDASDGVMNGMMGGTAISMTGMGGMMGGALMQPTAGTTALATAMTQFMTSGMNKSGVTQSDVQPLLDKLSTSNGTLP